MTIRISHSAKDKFQSCPRRYFHHYKQKLRSPKMGSALFFGNALDDAFSRMLLDKKLVKTEAELAQLELTPFQIFEAKMQEGKNDAGQKVQLAKSNLADYYTSDFDASLFTPEIVALVQEMDQNCNNMAKIVAFHEMCKQNLNFRNKNRRRLTDDEFILYNYINWLSLFEKGKLMLEAYQTQIMPQIFEVYDIQKKIEIVEPNTGDSITGLIDFTCSFVDQPGTKYICDNKTASKAYSDDSVDTSEQLATYCEAEQCFNAAYVVIQKTVFKKAPVIKTQIIKSTINDAILEKTFDIYANVVHNIVAAGEVKENYPQNTDSCFSFGKTCPYYSICKYNNSEHLIDCSVKEDK
jgi:hypothetical protein